MMHFKQLNALALSLALGFIPAADAYWRMGCPGTLLEGRLDSIVTPGKVSGHTHVILGGNGFAPTMNYESTQKSTCTSCSIKGDNSNYWIPKLYYHAQDGSFESVDVKGGTVYYQQRAEYPGKKLMAYPKGFRMVAGNPERRDYNNTLAEQAITHVCLNYKGGAPPEAPPLPSVNCPNGVRSQVYFPSCWDGKNVDSDDHHSHMAYPSNFNSGRCPDSHPNPMISVFFEFIFDTGKFADRWYGNKQPFVYSMGDDTGYGLHGDFLNGWDIDILQKGIDQKTTNDAGCAGDVKCGGIFDYPDSYGESCTLPPLIDEQINGKLAELPGCNPVTNNPVPHPDCKATKVLGVVTKNIFKDVTQTLKWKYDGCAVDDYYNRIMGKQIAASDSMTVETCIKACDGAGFKLAGLEYGRECWCANSIPDKAKPKPGVVGNCNKKCSGDQNEVCGDAGQMSLYEKCTGDCKNAEFGLVGDSGSGGATQPPATGGNTPAPAGGNTGGTGATGSTGGNTGGTGTTGSTGGTTGGTGASNPGSGSTGSTGSSGSSGSSGNLPGGKPPNTSTSTTTSKTSPTPSTSPSTSSPPSSGGATKLPAGWSAKGCYSDRLEQRALTGEHLAWFGEKISASNCAAHCDKNGFSISGVEHGGQCFCGNKLEGGSSPKPDNLCNVPCEGDAKQTCGGDLVLNIASKSNSLRRRSQNLS